MTKLYELAEQYKELTSLENFDDEMQQALSDTMEALEGEFNDKAEAIAIVVTNMDAYHEAIDAEILRLNDRKRIIKNRQESVKNYLRDNMERSGIKKISCPLFSITCRAGRDVVVVDNEDRIPDEYMSVETKLKPNKGKILSKIKAGEDIEGCHIEKSKSSIIIK